MLRFALVLLALSATLALQVGEVSMNDIDELSLTGEPTLDQLQQLVTKARDAPVTDFPALLQEAKELASKLNDASKQTLLQVFITMRVRVTQEIETLTKEIEDTKVIINARIADKELKITKLKDEMLQLQKTYEENQAQRLREIETIKKVKALLIKIMDTILEVRVTKEETTTTNKSTTSEESSTKEKQTIKNGVVVQSEKSASAPNSATSTSSQTTSNTSSTTLKASNSTTTTTQQKPVRLLE